MVDALDPPQAAIVCTSYGGHIGIRSAAAHPDRISHLVELSWAFGQQGKVPLFMRTATLPGARALAGSMPANERVVRAMFKRIGLRGALEAGKVSGQMVAPFTALLRHTDTMRNEAAAGPPVITLRGVKPEALLTDELLASITVPTLFLWGRDDPIGGPDLGRAFAARIPGARFEEVVGGHAPWIDDAEGIAAKVTDFLRSL